MKRQLLWISLASMFSMGAYDMMRGIAAPLMQTDWHLSYLEVGVAFSIGSCGYLVDSFIAGLFVDRLGLKTMTITGSLLTLAGVLLLVTLNDYTWLIGGFVALGLGGGALEIGVNGVVPAISESTRDQTRYFNWLHGFYGVGATGFPLAAIWVLRETGSWRSGYLLAMSFTALILLFVTLVPYKGMTTVRATTGDEDDITLSKLLKSPVLYGLLIAITTYVMAEVGLASWLPTYLVQVRGLSITQGSMYLSGFYLLFTIGRLTGHWWVQRAGNARAVLASSVVAVLSLGIAVLGGGWTVFMFIIAGLGFAIIFPTIAAVASDTYASHAGKVLGFLFTASGIGSFIANWMIGQVASSFGLEAGFGLIFVYLTLVFASMLLVVWFGRPKAVPQAVQNTSA